MRVGVHVLRSVLLAAVGAAPVWACGSHTTGGAQTSGGTAPPRGAKPATPFTCKNPEPLSVAQIGAQGMELCDGEVIHRVPGTTCTSSLKPTDGPAPPAAPEVRTCRTNADCNERPHGQCVGEPETSGSVSERTRCIYGCLTDADCGEGSACVCGRAIGECMKGCRSDAECPNGEPCAYVVTGHRCSNTASLQCGVDCRTDADCPAKSGAHAPAGCVQGGCTSNASCGRPFLVGGAARVAPTETRSDWVQDSGPNTDGLPPGVRDALAAHFTELGAMEHASVAAFARFVLQLLSLGAPAALVSGATAALADETDHARLCFGIASAYAGRSVGPGALPMSGALEGVTFADVVRTAFAEACVGETCAALEAAECAAHATDPFVASALQRIAADETRHAELGWKFVTWALSSADAKTRRDLLQDFAAILNGPPEAEAVATDELLLSYGVPSASLCAAIRRTAMAEVVRPCLDALATRFAKDRTRHQAGAMGNV